MSQTQPQAVEPFKTNNLKSANKKIRDLTKRSLSLSTAISISGLPLDLNHDQKRQFLSQKHAEIQNYINLFPSLSKQQMIGEFKKANLSLLKDNSSESLTKKQQVKNENSKSGYLTEQLRDFTQYRDFTSNKFSKKTRNLDSIEEERNNMLEQLRKSLNLICQLNDRNTLELRGEEFYIEIQEALVEMKVKEKLKERFSELSQMEDIQQEKAKIIEIKAEITIEKDNLERKWQEVKSMKEQAEIHLEAEMEKEKEKIKKEWEMVDIQKQQGKIDQQEIIKVQADLNQLKIQLEIERERIVQRQEGLELSEEKRKQEIELLKRDLSENSNHISNAANQIAKLQKREDLQTIEELKNQLKHYQLIQEQENKILSAQIQLIKDKDNQLATFNNKFNSMQSELQEIYASSSQKNALVETDTQEKEIITQKIKDELVKAKEEISHNKQVQQELYEMNKNSQQKIKEMEIFLQEKDTKMIQIGNELSQIKQDLSFKILEYQQLICEKDILIREKDGKIESRDSIIAIKDQHIQNKEDILLEKEQLIKSLKELCEGKQTIIREQEHQINVEFKQSKQMNSYLSNLLENKEIIMKQQHEEFQQLISMQISKFTQLEKDQKQDATTEMTKTFQSIENKMNILQQNYEGRNSLLSKLSEQLSFQTLEKSFKDQETISTLKLQLKDNQNQLNNVQQLMKIKQELIISKDAEIKKKEESLKFQADTIQDLNKQIKLQYQHIKQLQDANSQIITLTNNHKQFTESFLKLKNVEDEAQEQLTFKNNQIVELNKDIDDFKLKITSLENQLIIAQQTIHLLKEDQQQQHYLQQQNSIIKFDEEQQRLDNENDMSNYLQLMIETIEEKRNQEEILLLLDKIKQMEEINVNQKSQIQTLEQQISVLEDQENKQKIRINSLQESTTLKIESQILHNKAIKKQLTSIIKSNFVRIKNIALNSFDILDHFLDMYSLMIKTHPTLQVQQQYIQGNYNQIVMNFKSLKESFCINGKNNANILLEFITQIQQSPHHEHNEISQIDTFLESMKDNALNISQIFNQLQNFHCSIKLFIYE